MAKEKNNKVWIILGVIILIGFMMQSTGKLKEGFTRPSLGGDESTCQSYLYSDYNNNPGCFTECFYVQSTTMANCGSGIEFGEWMYFFDSNCEWSSSTQDTLDCLFDYGVEWLSYVPPDGEECTLTRQQLLDIIAAYYAGDTTYTSFEIIDMINLCDYATECTTNADCSTDGSTVCQFNYCVSVDITPIWCLKSDCSSCDKKFLTSCPTGYYSAKYGSESSCTTAKSGCQPTCSQYTYQCLNNQITYSACGGSESNLGSCQTGYKCGIQFYVGDSLLPLTTVRNNVCTPESCVPDCSCAANTCKDSTCSNGCNGICAGTKDCGSICSQCNAWSSCVNNQQTRTCPSGSSCVTVQSCTTPTPSEPTDWNKYLPWIIGFFVVIFGIKLLSTGKK